MELSAHPDDVTAVLGSECPGLPTGRAASYLPKVSRGLIAALPAVLAVVLVVVVFIVVELAITSGAFPRHRRRLGLPSHPPTRNRIVGRTWAVWRVVPTPGDLISPRSSPPTTSPDEAAQPPRARPLRRLGSDSHSW